MSLYNCERKLNLLFLWKKTFKQKLVSKKKRKHLNKKLFEKI